jgi:TonB-dependent SusC/RagA subfamily outer membrane receptor
MRIKIFFLILLSVLCLNSVTAQKNSKRMTITGSVVDVARRPIVNAIIMIDNKKTNSMTDSKGTYKIKVKRNASKIGIFTFGNGIIEEEINGRTRINFNFRTGAFQQLPDQNIAPGEDAINVGYKYVKKKNLTYSVSKIDGTNKKYASYSSIYDMIQREVAGVQVNGTTIVIQDSKNLLGYVPPLFIVDGIYVDTIEDIRPSVVESIEVLKGASAAIYGSRGYGGAILIKTKTGQINK